MITPTKVTLKKNGVSYIRADIYERVHDESESRLKAYLAQIDATRVTLDKLAAAENDNKVLREFIDAAISDRDYYIRERDALQARIDAGIRCRAVRPFPLVGDKVVQARSNIPERLHNATILLDDGVSV